MAFVHCSGVVDGISGVVGGIEFRRGRDGTVCATRRMRSSSVCTLQARGLVKADVTPFRSGEALSIFWKQWWAESPEFRRQWDVWASAADQKDVFGVRRPVVGWRACFHALWTYLEAIGMKLWALKMGPLPVAPGPGGWVYGPVVSSVSASSDPTVVTVDCTLPVGMGANVVLYCARNAGNLGVSSVKGWRYCGAEASWMLPVDFGDWFRDIAWELQSGEKIWCELYAARFQIRADARWWMIRSNSKFFNVTVS
jgi:hypothetical protein